ncbi:MAG: L,D-transpeptidase family protein [Hyphomicrobiales bacterium]
MRMTGDEAAMVAKRALSTFSICLGAAALAAAFAVAPANAKNGDATEEAIPDPNDGQPMTLIVSLKEQRVDVYRGMSLITTSKVSTGKPGHATKAGVFSILEKQRYHRSNLYGGAPMPWMNRITWSGTALHAGVVPGYPASHGCIRLPYSFAPRLFKITTVGEHVIVAKSRVAPKLIEHPALFQPLPLPMPPMLVKHIDQQQQPVAKERQSTNDAAPVDIPQKQSSNEADPSQALHLPVILAKAESSVVTDAPDISVDEHGLTPVEMLNVAIVAPPRPDEDTHIHAIDPFAAPPSRVAHGVPVSASPDEVVAATAGGLTKGQDRLGGDALPASQAALPDSGETEASKAEMTSLTVTAMAMHQPVPAPLAAVVPVTAPIPDMPPEPPAGPVLTVMATMAQPEAPAPALAMLTFTDPDHPPLPPAKPSAMVAKIVAGVVAAGAEAAEPPSTAPLRILITRRTQRDRMIDVQYMLSSMGYLEAQNFDGTFGRLTASAIKAFQKANDMPETGAFTDDVVKKIYEVAGKGEPPVGHLFVRQEFGSVFDVPVSFRNPDEPLGTHLFTVMKFQPGDTKAQWMSVDLQGDEDGAAVLDRLEIPSDIRQKISERLTPGSSLIIGDTAINSATLPKGADFLVWDTSKPGKVQNASLTPDEVSPQPRKKRRTVTRRTPTPSYTQTYRRRPGWPF